MCAGRRERDKRSENSPGRWDIAIHQWSVTVECQSLWFPGILWASGKRNGTLPGSPGIYRRLTRERARRMRHMFRPAPRRYWGPFFRTVELLLRLQQSANSPRQLRRINEQPQVPTMQRRYCVDCSSFAHDSRGRSQIHSQKELKDI